MVATGIYVLPKELVIEKRQVPCSDFTVRWWVVRWLCGRDEEVEEYVILMCDGRGWRHGLFNVQWWVLILERECGRERGDPFLATIHAEINVFDKEISLGTNNDRVSYDMEKRDHNFTIPTEKIFMIKSDLDNRPLTPASSNNKPRNLHDRSLNDSLHVFDLEINQLANEYELEIGKKRHMLDKIWEYCEDVHRDNTYWWHDHGLEEEEPKEIGIKIEKYDPPEV
ncbi:hypothetical protein Tco_0877285 [Tanacetum coccineum]|uniref:Uncharacterized protein n=1 Tax=Tanacetum coccineum TaxID=301880 RepID=A0ABQ5C0F5_9ASTR